MKTQGFQKTGFAAALVAVIFTANVFGQATPTVTTETTPPPLVPNAPTTAGPYLSPATSQVLQLTQAKVSDTTIIAYVQNSSTMYGLNADQIIYLKQQGVSDGVLNAMLNQSSRVAAAVAAQPPSNYGQPTPPDQQPDQSSTAVVQPTTAAPSSVYTVPDSQTANYNAWASQYYSYPTYYAYPYYYPYYYWPVTFSFYYGYHGGYYRPWYGWHGGYWNGGWHGGTWGGGSVHTGGTWNGGGGGSFHSGGSMGGGGGFHH